MVESAKVLHEKKHLQELELRWWHDDENVREPPLWWEDPIAERHMNEKENSRLEKEKILQELVSLHSIKN